MIDLYGIKTCSTVSKAKKYLEQQGIAYQFHDFRQEGVNEEQLGRWMAFFDWTKLLNKRSLTWRKLSDETKKNMDENLALETMLQEPTIIKRPVLEVNHKPHLLGFSEKLYSELK